MLRMGSTNRWFALAIPASTSSANFSCCQLKHLYCVCHHKGQVGVHLRKRTIGAVMRVNVITLHVAGFSFGRKVFELVLLDSQCRLEKITSLGLLILWKILVSSADVSHPQWTLAGIQATLRADRIRPRMLRSGITERTGTESDRFPSRTTRWSSGSNVTQPSAMLGL